MSEQRFSTPDPVRLAVELPAGEIEVETVDGEESTVIIDGSPRLVEAVEVQLHAGRLHISLRRRTWSVFGRLDGSLSIHVRIPHHSAAEFATASGDIVLAGSFGPVQARSASGALRGSGEVAKAVVKTVSGDVNLVQVTGDLTVQSVSGEVHAEAVGGSVSVKSVSGHVYVGSLRQGTATMHSVSGDVELGIARGTNVDLDARSASGQLSCEVPLSDAPGAGPGPTIVVRSNTVSGDFRIVRAA